MRDATPEPLTPSIGFDVLRIADSALPVGGFAFSNGLEAASKLGMIRTRPELECYWQNAIEQLGDMELPFLRAAHVDANTPDRALAHILEEWAATITSAAMRRASLRQGKGMLRWLEQIHPETKMQALSDWLRTSSLQPHYLPVFAIGMARLGLTTDRTAHLFMFMFVRDQISAAVRLGLIGPMDGQALQRSLLDTASNVLAHAPQHHYMDAVRSCPVIELSQGYHDHLYSKLFQS